MAVRERHGSRIWQPQGAVSLRETPFASNSIIWLPSNPSADLGTRGHVPTLNGSNVFRTGTDGLEVYHPSTSGADSLVWTAPAGAENGFALLLRFRLDTSSQTTLFNSANEVTTTSAVQIRTSSVNLQYVDRDTAVRFTSSGVPLVLGKWHTVALRLGNPEQATIGRQSGRMWIDGELVGNWTTTTTAGNTFGDFAVACGRYATDTAQARAHSVSLAAFAFDSASDEELRAASENPYGYLFGDRRIWVPVSAGGGPSAELDADATASATSTGAITTGIQLAGAAILSAVAAGSLSTAVQLAAQALAAGQAVGDLSTAINLQGAAATATLASGELSTQIRLDGAALAAAIASAGLTTLILLAAAAQGGAQAAGALSTGEGLEGAATGAAQATGSLTTLIVLSGAAVSSLLASGELSTTPSGLVGAATAGAQASGALTTQIPLAGGAQVSVIASGAVTTGVTLAGAAVAVVSATGDLVIALELTAQALASAIAGADLRTAVVLRADAVAGAQAGGVLAGLVYKASPWRTHVAAARVRNHIAPRRLRVAIAGVR